MTKRRFIRIFLIVCAIFWVAGCAGNRPEIVTEAVNLPGVYPDVRAAAGIQAEKLIATTQMKMTASEHQAVGDAYVETSEEMWQVFLKAAKNRNFSRNSLDKIDANPVEPADSLESVEVSRLPGDVISADLMKLTAELYLQRGIRRYDQAILANPLNLQLYLGQGEINSKKARRFGDKDAAEKSIREYEHLLQYQKGQHALYSRLGQNYEELDQWASAYQNHQMALEIYHGSRAFFQLKQAPGDTVDSAQNQLTEVNYWINKANSETRLFIADDALLSWYISLSHATEVDDIKFICDNIEHVMWDSLNVAAAVRRDSILTQWVREENADKALADYLNLLPKLKTQRAFDEVSALAADVEFTDENQREQAIARILEIVRRTDSNPVTADLAEAPVDFMDYYFMHLDSTGTRVVFDRNIESSNVIYQKITSYKIPVDSTYRKIYQLAGQMCFEYGTYQMEHGKFEFAKKYLEASCSIEWPERFLALYKLARFYSVRANPKAAISKCYDIALMHDALNQRQVKEYLSLLVRLFRNRKIRQREVAQEIYQLYSVYNKGGRVPWDTIYRYLEPYHSY